MQILVPVSLFFLWLTRPSLQKLPFTSGVQKHYNETLSCRKLPSQDFLTAQQVDVICHHRSQWLKERDNEESKRFLNPTERQKAYLRSVERCTRFNCVHEARRKKRQSAPQKSIRKEVRMMTTDERQRVFAAMNALKSKFIDNITAWDLHTLVHYPDSAPGAHWGPAFLPWHREFLRQFEIALQQEDPTVTLPYWDSTLDEALPDPADSVLWTDELAGNGNGYVKTGPFRDWDTNVLMPLSQIPVKKLYRSTGGREQDRLMTPKDVQWITSRRHYKDLTFCHDKTFESIHGLSHVWVGGFMFVIRVSPNDPMFYMHHSFVDFLWEKFRRQRQTREQRETQWATETCNSKHDYYAQMKPFRLQNRDGLSNQYTDEWYDYEPVRHCTPIADYCDSPYYWCDTKTWRCRSRVVFGGNCQGYDGTEICYKSVCQQGRCQVPARLVSSQRRLLLQNSDELSAAAEEPVVERHRVVTSSLPRGDHVWTKTVLLDQFGDGIESESASVSIKNELTGETTTIYHGNKSAEFPELPGMIYLPLPKPSAGMIQNATLEARDGHGRYCQAHCYNETVERFQVCQPHLAIGFRAETSSPLSYTHSMMSRKYLDVDLSVHPRQLGIFVPYMIFACSRKLMTSAMIQSLPEKLHISLNREPQVFLRVVLLRREYQALMLEVRSDVDSEPWTSSVLRAASPYDPTVVFIQAPNPELHPNGVRIQVNIYENDQPAVCTAKCTRKDGSTFECDGSVLLHSEPEMSEEDVFTSDQSSLQLLGWNMRGHPTQWRHKVPYLAFHC